MRKKKEILCFFDEENHTTYSYLSVLGVTYWIKHERVFETTCLHFCYRDQVAILSTKQLSLRTFEILTIRQSEEEEKFCWRKTKYLRRRNMSFHLLFLDEDRNKNKGRKNWNQNGSRILTSIWLFTLEILANREIQKVYWRFWQRLKKLTNTKLERRGFLCSWSNDWNNWIIKIDFIRWCDKKDDNDGDGCIYGSIYVADDDDDDDYNVDG